ncbi:putative acyl-CoA dehydrogenase AidB [Pseudovibrio sp. Ad13]|uniref:acyl-CoA dehydrogenase family protein n=1 Tax=unclassified Pseudovibrio TaxID=2627060 RepID=UPI0007B2596A|nr:MULTISPECIES: acyl-CoA dehydrogenase family protein [unclassified Pseudovibrio]KZK81094.1 putative acyl-CoA dehydrogenase AidB [Pseudovibrio sp. Ad13]KZL00602.1 putative acyl-CoA dehydrogenase AidB [Pseudovibrio sp. W74]KZL05851.1 putative acyl-CoA dehydrogenase AidB [Pseudovibrio sp. Ad26]KZL06792.1 putative acyl-CoA dehydrogenase AidB [Pseudovibrio sp. Ad14]
MDKVSQATMTTGVINQAPPYCGYNLAESDPILLADLGGTGSNDSAREELIKFGEQCGAADALDLGRLANVNEPVLKTHDPYGRRLDVVEFHPSYHALMRRSFEAGLHSASVESMEPGGERAFYNRARKYFVMSQVEGGHLCPVTMTNASAMALTQAPELAKVWNERILSRKYDQRFRPASQKMGASLGMGMTEKQGGSDLRQIITRAEKVSDDTYVINGHKWFFSAPMCDAFLVLAKLEEGPTCFLVPRILESGEVNGLDFQRLKNKLGNKSNASSEVEFNNAVGFLVGEVGKGIKTILKMVTPTRVDCCIGSSALMRAAISRAVHHTSNRSAFGARLIEKPLMQRVLADMSLDMAASEALALKLSHCMDLEGEDSQAADFLRIITPAAKYWICKSAENVAAEAMECLGGNGYVEDHDMARIYREAPVNSIWEGSGNIMALDLLRAMHRTPDSFMNVLGMLEADLGPAGKVSVEVLQAAARTCLEDEGGARLLTEQLAITAAAAALKEVAPPAIANAFIETRMAGQWRSSYGMLDARYDAKGILEWLYPIK